MSIAVNKLNELGIEEICNRIEAGESQLNIAKSLSIGVSQLNAWLNLDIYRERYARAKTESAEGWLDRGLEKIESAMKKDGNIDPGAARSYAGECARRAAIRNPKYSDKQRLEHTGESGGPITVSWQPPGKS